jgi:ATP-dependent Clp protease ATP-binding subunit ClpA
MMSEGPQFTPRAIRALVAAEAQASVCDHSQTTSLALLYGLIQEDEDVVALVFRECAVDLMSVRSHIKAMMHENCDEEDISVLLEKAHLCARSNGDEWVGSLHILAALLDTPQCKAIVALTHCNCSLDAIRNERDALLSRFAGTKLSALDLGSIPEGNELRQIRESYREIDALGLDKSERDVRIKKLMMDAIELRPSDESG